MSQDVNVAPNKKTFLCLFIVFCIHKTLYGVNTPTYILRIHPHFIHEQHVRIISIIWLESDERITFSEYFSSVFCHKYNITITGGTGIKGITASNLKQKSEDYTISGTITASKNGSQSTKDFDQLVVKGPDTATKVTKIEYGTEKSCPTLFGIYKFSDGYDEYKTVKVTLSDEKGAKELANLLDGK